MFSNVNQSPQLGLWIFRKNCKYFNWFWKSIHKNIFFSCYKLALELEILYPREECMWIITTSFLAKQYNNHEFSRKEKWKKLEVIQSNLHKIKWNNIHYLFYIFISLNILSGIFSWHWKFLSFRTYRFKRAFIRKWFILYARC